MQVSIQNNMITLVDRQTANGYIQISYEQLAQINGVAARAYQHPVPAPQPTEPPKGAA